MLLYLGLQHANEKPNRTMYMNLYGAFLVSCNSFVVDFHREL